jgi:hypothetical protein
MDTIDCAAGERLQLGVGACLQVTGYVAGLIYVFVETAWGHALDVERGFRASTSGDAGWISSVLALSPGDPFSIASAQLRIDVLTAKSSECLLRPFRIRMDAPHGTVIARDARLRLRLPMGASVCVPLFRAPLFPPRHKEPRHASSSRIHHPPL